MNIKKSDSNTKFRGIYALNGDAKALESGVEWVTKRLNDEHLNFAFKEIQKQKDEITLGIATSTSVDDINKDWFNEFAQKKVIDAKDLVNPNKIIRFNALNGYNEKVQIFYREGKEFLCSVFTGKFHKVKTINQVRFDEPKPLREALSELFVIPSSLTLGREVFSYDNRSIARLLNHNEKEIKKCYDMHKFDVTALVGYGASSTVLELGNAECLKLSIRPNAPLEDEIFDMQTIFKDKIKLDTPLKVSPHEKTDFFYYTIQKKTINNNEHFITPEHVSQVANQMTELGYYWNPAELKECQIGLLDGKPYLIDAQVPKNRVLFK